MPKCSDCVWFDVDDKHSPCSFCNGPRFEYVAPICEVRKLTEIDYELLHKEFIPEW